MERERLSKLLSHFGVRVTPVRYLLYQALEEATVAMSLSDLEVELRTVDKSSIFRNLQLFLEAGLIHQIQDGSGIAKYAVSQVESTDHPLTHAHFTSLPQVCRDDLPRGHHLGSYTASYSRGFPSRWIHPHTQRHLPTL